MRDRSALPLLVLPALLVITLVAYWPGLQGGFLFDDFSSLPILGAYGPIDHWDLFWRYITSGAADPTGRPLTLLSFLLDARNWPADPFPFKRTNLVLHLLNGVLLYTLLIKLGQMLGIHTQQNRIAAWFASALWLLHPLLVSTTLYVVQREAMLPATCVLGGLLIWLHGRDQLVKGKITNGACWSVLGLGGFTLLGMLAKPNGALLPVFALLIEIIILAPRRPLPAGKTRHVHRMIILGLGVLPGAAIFLYLLWMELQGIHVGGLAESRAWSYPQRLLTEPRVLMNYLQLLWLPRPFSSGLFNDQYVASTSWLHPLTTVPCIFAVSGLIVGAWLLRHRYPALAVAVLFYFAGQLLESTSIPLELYFEHRNYVPALLMFWPLGLWLADKRQIAVVKRILLISLPLTFALMTHARADLWGNVRDQALIWAKINPDSGRAQANAAEIEMQTGHPKEAALRLETFLADQPDQAQLAFNLITARCMTGGISAGDIAATTKAMQHTFNPGSLIVNWFERTIPIAIRGSCPGLTTQSLLDWLDAGLKNPHLADASRQQDLVYLRGRIALASNLPDAALSDFNRALDLQVRPDVALGAAAALGASGYPKQGLDLLDHYQQIQGNAISPTFGMPVLHAWILARQGYWPYEFAALKHQLTLDAQGQRTDNARQHSFQSKQG